MYDEFRHPSFNPNVCQQAGSILELSRVISRVDERLETHGEILKQVAEGLGEIRVLSERDLRREKDIEIAFSQIRKLQENCRMEDRIKETEKATKEHGLLIERVTVKMAVIASTAMIIGGAIGAAIVKVAM